MKGALGSIDISPRDISRGYAMAGYSRKHVACGVLDPVQASGVLVEDIHPALGIRKHLLIIAIDTLKLPMVFVDYIKEKIQETYHIPPNQVILHAVHTHQAPDLTGEFHYPGGIAASMRGIMFGLNRNDKYMVFVASRVVVLVGQLLSELRPCKMGFAKTIVQDDIIVNRRHPTRRSKSDLVVWSFKDANTREIFGMLVNFSCHPTTLTGKNDKLSADFPGQVLKHVTSLSRGKITPVFFNGPSGDINPITTCGTDFEHLNLNKIYSQHGTYDDTKAIGKVIATHALDLARSIPDSDYFEHVEYKSYVRTIWVPLKDFDRYHTAEPLKAAWVRLQNRVIYLVKKYFLLPIVLAIADGSEPNFPGLAIKHRGSKMNVYSKIQYIKVRFFNDSGTESYYSIMALPGELFEDIGKVFKARSPTGEHTLIIQNANDWFAYFFDLDEYIGQGGMEPLEGTTPVAGYYIKKEYLQFLEDIDAGLTGGHS